MLTSKQRAKLRGIASTGETILKLRVLETSPAPVREVAQQLAEATGSEVVQVIGMKLVLYRRNPEKPVIDLG